ncbi:MAG: CopG family transcriptional regulator [Firmicutes bacterium]|nr:CopG family transcriptional regulator [Bacillota bacterium]
MKHKKKQEVITFKVEAELGKAMEGIPNRSEFIRTAILAALRNTCPLCRGTGILTPEQQKHWKEFAENHRVKKCDDCQSFHLVCEVETE